MANDRIRILHTLFLPAMRSGGARPWQPTVDVYRLRDGWLLKFELAGVRLEDVSVVVQGARVIVRGSRLDHCRESGCSFHQLEIAYNTFERSVELPDDLAGATIECEFQHGMLLARITLGSPR